MDDENAADKKMLLPMFLMAGLFVLIDGLALLMIKPFSDQGMTVFENANDPFNLVIFFGILLGMTVAILLIAKYWKKWLIRALILFAVGYTSFYVFFPLFALAIQADIAFVLSAGAAVLLTVVLFKYPEWYIIDLCGIIVGSGAIALFGISLGMFLVILILIGLAIYDAISVYKTKHMIDLADTVMDLKLPVLLVIPKIRHYSLLKETKRLKDQLKEGTERDAFFMGLGDIVMPGILVAAAYSSIENSLPIVVSIIIGTLVGFMVLMTFVMKGKPQAGLPCLCGGALAGYVISSLVLHGSLVGLTLPF
ncbi:MAG: presenilin family intramembrane aspartyl protease PSH [Methanobacteriota archaeon]